MVIISGSSNMDLTLQFKKKLNVTSPKMLLNLLLMELMNIKLRKKLCVGTKIRKVTWRSTIGRRGKIRRKPLRKKTLLLYLLVIKKSSFLALIHI